MTGDMITKPKRERNFTIIPRLLWERFRMIGNLSFNITYKYEWIIVDSIR